jgi:hypothetical protein
MKEKLSWNSVVVLGGSMDLPAGLDPGQKETHGRSLVYVDLAAETPAGDESACEAGGAGINRFTVPKDTKNAGNELNSMLADAGINAPLFCLADAFWKDYFLKAFSPGKFALLDWGLETADSEKNEAFPEFASVDEGVASYVAKLFPVLKGRTGGSRPLNVLMLVSPQYMYVNTIRDYCEAFDLFSKHRFCYASVNKASDSNLLGPTGENLDYSGFDVLMIHYSARVAYWEKTIDDMVIEAIRKFSGYKILFIQDEYDHTETAREKISDLGIHEVFTCVPDPFIGLVYPAERFPGVTFTSFLTGYLPPSLENNPDVIPLAERPYHIVYRGRPLPYYYGSLGQEKWLIGKNVKAACEARSIPHDIEWAEGERIYGNQWNWFLHSGRATLGTESGSNVFDPDGVIRENVDAALQENPHLSYEEARTRFFKEDNLGVKMNQISPKIFEFIAARTVLILYEGEYSGVLQPNVHYLPLKKDESNLAEILDTLNDLAKLQELVDRAYADIVEGGKHNYRTFVGEVDAILDERAREFATRCLGYPQNLLSVSSPLKAGKLSQAVFAIEREKLSIDKLNFLMVTREAPVAHLKSKKGNFHGMITRRKQKIEKLSERIKAH